VFLFQYVLPLSLMQQYNSLSAPTRLYPLQFDSTQQAYFTIPSNYSATATTAVVQFSPLLRVAVNSTTRASLICYMAAAPATASIPAIYNQAFKIERFNRTFDFPQGLSIFMDASSPSNTGTVDMQVTYYGTIDPTGSPVTARPANLQQVMFFFETVIGDPSLSLSALQFSYLMDKNVLANAKVKDTTVRFATFINNQWQTMDSSFFNPNTSIVTQTLPNTGLVGKWALLGDKASGTMALVQYASIPLIMFILFMIMSFTM